MRKGILAVAAIGAVALSGMAACGSSDNNSNSSGSNSGSNAKQPFVGVILPDTKSSARYETQDLPNLTAAFKAAGVKASIQNAQGDTSTFQTIADSMLTQGVNVLIIDSLDSASGTAVINKAKQQGVPVIDYDRLTAGGGAQFYVSFDNVAVGKLQGQGLQACLAQKNAQKPMVAELNGAPTDNNATQFAQGYNSILNPLYAAGTYVKGPNQSVPDWDNTQAGTIFEQMLTAKPQIKGVLVANDGMANSVISILKKNKLQLPVTGQDATVQGLQHIMDGDQCMTVFKDTKKEADAASQLAIALAKGEKPTTAQQVTVDPTTKANVPSVLLTPEKITIQNVNDVVAAGGTTKAALCTGTYAAKCTSAGVK
jgi:ABC-type xylose transport system, periplasmic component